MRPIWKDYYDTISGTSIHFCVSESGSTEILFEGRADALPGEELYIHANKVCETLLDLFFPKNTGVTVHNEAAKTFVFKNADNDDHILDTDLIYDWSYEDVEYGNNVLTKPINGHLDPRMKLICTTYNNDSNNLVLEDV